MLGQDVNRLPDAVLKCLFLSLARLSVPAEIIAKSDNAAIVSPSVLEESISANKNFVVFLSSQPLLHSC